ncbi:hypothetical protein SELMODRAFT_408349 [Selaginella moellendorffii]|uniref:Uncharacterized protein n=1 Tax=Selaginella moellendorffii TaxID=88036 RepID=D8R805_SELML|nr:hypothetical protein SELMODRAFT_408349 [Selaginella moellendorffii]
MRVIIKLKTGSERMLTTSRSPHMNKKGEPKDVMNPSGDGNNMIKNGDPNLDTTKNEEPPDANENEDPNKNANHEGDEPNVELNAELDPNDKEKEHCLHVRPFSDFRIEWLERFFNFIARSGSDSTIAITQINFHLRILEMLPRGSKMEVYAYEKGYIDRSNSNCKHI